MYLYFNEKLKKIVACVAPTDKEGLTPLTMRQVERWQENPRAHWSQIMNGQPPVEPPTPAEPTLEELKAEAVKRLSDLSLEVLGWHVSEYQLMNARLSLEAEAGDKIYDDGKSAAVVETYLRIGKLCRTAYYEAKAEIEACECATDLNDVYERWKEYYNGIE